MTIDKTEVFKKDGEVILVRSYLPKISEEELSQILYEGLKSRLPKHKKTWSQSFWVFFQGIFQFFVDTCMRMRVSVEERTEDQVLAGEMASIIQENYTSTNELFGGMGNTSDPEDSEMHRIYGPSGDTEPMLASDYFAIVEKVKKARLKHLLNKSNPTPADESELSDLTKDKEIIIME